MTYSIIDCIDLTSLNTSDTPKTIDVLCDKAIELGPVAAVCVYPGFVSQVAKRLGGHPIKVATVVNFPQGIAPINTVVQDIDFVIKHGADEIDVVMPYRDFATSKSLDSLCEFVQACKDACQGTRLKVILETGALKNAELIKTACRAAISGGADFLKTSTGKIPMGATPEAVSAMLEVILEHQEATGRRIGIKISGGVKTVEDAKNYYQQVKQALGLGTLDPQHFRIGASGLLEALLKAHAPLGQASTKATTD
jgi:deoxyribose-phosphate aldolase